MKFQDFNHYAAEGYNRIPLVREVLADLDTPLSAYMKLAAGPYSYLFESVQGGEQWGRYSIIGLPAEIVASISGKNIQVSKNRSLIEELEAEDPLSWIEDFRTRFRVPEVEGLPRFTGGLVGYFGYDTIRYIEPRLAECPNPDPLETPDILLMVSDQVLVFDNLSGKLLIIVHVDPAENLAYENGLARLDELVQQLEQGTIREAIPGKSRDVNEKDFVSGFTRKNFESAVECIKEYIVEGDAMQVVISQRLSIPYKASPMNLYRALRCLNPSPYLYFLDLDDFHIVGSSPEILVRVEDGEVTVRPIAGTRPRGENAEADQDLEEDLLNDPKELAEHLMLIDLGRNDVGRVAEIGSVKLTDKMIVERYSHVMHIVSNVIGQG